MSQTLVVSSGEIGAAAESLAFVGHSMSARVPADMDGCGSAGVSAAAEEFALRVTVMATEAAGRLVGAAEYALEAVGAYEAADRGLVVAW